MPSKQKQQPESSEEDIEYESQEEIEYDDEEDDDIEMDASESNDDGIRVANKANLLNYESDDSDEDLEGEDSDDFQAGIKKQKQELQGNDAWGQKKQNFYGRDKKRDDQSSSDDDQDEYQEALRLQKVRARKLQQQQQEASEQEDEAEPSEELESSEEGSDDENLLKKSSKKLGDRLFADEESDSENKETSTLNTKTLDSLTKQMNPKLLKQIIEKESPEMQGLLEEFQEALDTLNNKLRPVLEKAQKGQIETKHGMTYLEMKYNLLLSYSTFLSFYLLLKLEGKPVKDHPVIFKLAHIKTLIEKLKPLDQRLQYQIDKLLRTAAVADLDDGKAVKDNMKYKPNVKNLQESGDEEEDMGSDEYDDEEAEGGDMEDESDIDEDLGGEPLSDEDDDDENPAQKHIFKAAKKNPVLYEDKETKKQRREELSQKRKMGKSQYIEELRREMYDEPEEVHMGINKKTKISKEQDLIESMEQEHFKRMNFTKKEMKKQRQRQQDELQERLDNLDDLRDIENIVSSKRNKERTQMQADAELENTKFQKSLNNYIKNAGKDKKKNKKGDDMLDESEFKKKSKGGRDNGEGPTKKRKLNFNDFEAKGNLAGDDLYKGHQDKQREKKAMKKQMDKQNKEAQLQDAQEKDKAIQRNVGYDILKNKGLTRKRKKIDSNSRVKHREKFRKAMIKRGSKVSEFKEGPKGKYGGEASGLKGNLIKSTKLT